MKHPIETNRLPQKVKLKLLEIRKETGIENWNILCRWAFCMSLNEADEPDLLSANSSDVNAIEMTWKTFGGEHASLYACIFTYRRKLFSENVNAVDYFNMHLLRGIDLLRCSRDWMT